MGRRREIGFQAVGIYKITSPSGRIYIGQSWNIGKRLSNYKSLDGTCKDQPKLYNSLKKYGPRHHAFEIAHELPKDVEQSVLDTYEVFYWQQHKDCGYEMLNIREPGIGGRMDESSKLKMRNAKLGIKRPVEAMNRMRETKKGKTMGAENHFYGKKHTDEARAKMREGQKRRYERGDTSFLGKSHSEETKRKISESKKGKLTGNGSAVFGKPSPLRGRKLSQDVIEKMKKAQQKRYGSKVD